MRESTLILSRPQALISRAVGFSGQLWRRSKAHPGTLAFWVLLLGTGLVGCGEKDDPPAKKQRPVLPIAAVRDAPADYELADPACQSRDEPQVLTQFTIPAWNGDEVTTRQVRLVETASRDSLVSPAIGSTVFGEERERECEDTGRGTSGGCPGAGLRDQPWTTINPGQPLRICKDGFAYGRSTYEGIAVTAAYYLQLARNRYLEASRDKKSPDPIALSVMPHVVDYYTTLNAQSEKVRIKKYIVHNLAYFPDSTAIAIFPESKRRAASARGFFWESSFVLAHEYGHHIDLFRHGIGYRKAGLSYDPMRHGFRDELAPSGLTAAESPRGLLGGAIAEAFADLLAFYTEGGTGKSVTGLPDIGANRDVGSSYFGNGDDKLLSEDRLQAFFRDTPEEDLPPGSIRFTEIHTIGAIFAHAADQIFKRLLKTQPSLDPSGPEGLKQRYLLALDWMDALTQSLAEAGPETGREALLMTVPRAFESAAYKHFASFSLGGDAGPAAADLEATKRDICLTAEVLLPALGRYPFAQTSGSCP